MWGQNYIGTREVPLLRLFFILLCDLCDCSHKVLILERSGSASAVQLQQLQSVTSCCRLRARRGPVSASTRTAPHTAAAVRARALARSRLPHRHIPCDHCRVPRQWISVASFSPHYIYVRQHQCTSARRRSHACHAAGARSRWPATRAGSDCGRCLASHAPH